MARAPIFVLEGAWDKTHENPQILPYLNAYEQSHGEAVIRHRTFRNVEDIEYYVSRIPKNSRSFLYFACHGEEGYLIPSDGRSKIPMENILAAIEMAKDESVAFVHFGCCAFVRSSNRRATLSKLLGAFNGRWVSGYSRDIDWLASTFLDLALISEVYVPWYKSDGRRVTQKTKVFFEYYEQLSRSLGLSAIYAVQKEERLFPLRLIGEE